MTDLGAYDRAPAAARVRPGGPAGPQGFSARRSLVRLGAFGASGLALSMLYARTGFGLPCPLREATGLLCPFCGGTRLGAALLHGDVAGAFGLNPFVCSGLVLLTVLGVLWTIEVVGGPRVRPTAGLRRTLDRVGPTRLTLLMVGLAAGYAVIRNLGLMP